MEGRKKSLKIDPINHSDSFFLVGGRRACGYIGVRFFIAVLMTLIWMWQSESRIKIT